MRVFRSLPVAAASPVALTIGNFDGVHIGHQAMLVRLTDAARELGVPPCVMTFEPHPREFFAPDKAPTRLTSLREKLELLARFGVERVHVCRFNFEFAKTTPEDFIDRILHRGLAARWILVGDDFRFGARRGGDLAMLKQAAGRCGFEAHAMASVIVDGVRVSSTAVREALAAGDMRRAQRLLGRPYSISGRVVSGDRLGRQTPAGVEAGKCRLTTCVQQQMHRRYRLGALGLQGLLGLRPDFAQRARRQQPAVADAAVIKDSNI